MTTGGRRRVEAPAGECSWEFVRSSGPGGQNVNKTATKAVLRWNAVRSTSVPADVRARFLARHASRITSAGEVILASDRYRDRPRNVEDALARLQALLDAVAEPPRPRRPSKPGRAAIERRIVAKKRRGGVKALRRRVDD